MDRRKKKVKFRSTYKRKKINYSWLLIIAIWTFIVAILFSYISNVLLDQVHLVAAFFILFCIVFTGVFFDGLGNAVVTADETPFHSMAAQKVKGAKESIVLIRNAPAVANFFNDVIGDICGIISGAAATAIVLKLEEGFGINSAIFGIFLSAFVASLTVGGKALGKEISIASSNYIVYYLGILLHIVGAGRWLGTKK